MADSRIDDMITMFEWSRTRTGARLIGGSAEYQSRYQRLANRAVSRLRQLWQADEIGFADLGPSVSGEGGSRRDGCDILINRTYEPHYDGDSRSGFDMVAERNKSATASLIMVHEAVHLVSGIDHGLEDEMACRTLELLYYRDLSDGFVYPSRVSGTYVSIRLGATTPVVGDLIVDLEFELEYHRRSQLVDYVVVTLPGYRDLLDTDFIARSFDWWGGIANRWMHTRGYYLRALATASRPRWDLILLILESVHGTGNWTKVKETAGDIAAIRRALRSGASGAPDFDARLSRLDAAVLRDMG